MVTSQKQAVETRETSRSRPKWKAGDEQAIQPFWVLVEMAILSGLIVLFNFFPEWIGFRVTADDPATFVAVLAPDFAVHMPWLNVFWGLGLALGLAKLSARRWTPLLRLADFGLSVLAIVVLIRLITGGPIILAEEQWPRELIPAAETFAGRLLPWLGAIKIWLVLALVGTILNTLRKLRYLPVLVVTRGSKATVKSLKEDSGVTMEWLTPNDLADRSHRPGQ